MQLISQSIKNLVAGISQQPPNLRHPEQLDEQINALSSETGGLQKRPPTLHINRLAGLLNGDIKPLVHFINRDEVEKYVVIFNGRNIEIYDLEGNQVSVTYAPSAAEYVASSDPRKYLRCTTIADYTFIVNTTKTTAMSERQGTNYFASQGALINIKSGQYGRNYAIYINGDLKASHTTPDGSDKSHTTQIDTNHIAGQLASKLNSAGYTTEQQEGWIYIKSSSITSVSTKDGYNNNSMFGILHSVQKFSNLPSTAPDGFVCKVQGEPGSDADDYYVKYSKEDEVWKECVAPGLYNEIDAVTMPHILVRKANGSFELKEATWDSRESGDEDSNLKPSFIDNTINDVFFYRNRLGFVAGENVILSRSADFFNFWVASVTAMQDTDPIDLAVSDNKVAILYHALPFGDDCLLFSGESQFALRSSGTLTPKTANIALLTNYTSTPKVKPVGAGRNVYFAAERAQYTSIKEYMTATDNSEEKEAQETSSHVPNLIPNGLYRIISSNAENILLFLTTGAENKLFVYKYLFMEGQRRQAAWSEWNLNAPIVGAEFIGSDLYLVVQRDDYYYLEKMLFTYNTVDYLEEPYRTFIDRKIVTNPIPAAAYDEPNNLTTIDISSYYNQYGLLPEQEYAIVSTDGVFNRIEPGISSVALVGNYVGQKLIIGQIYNYHLKFSEIMIKKQDDTGANIAYTEGRLQLRYMRLRYFNSGYFKVTVKHDNKLTYTYEMTGRNLDLANNIIGELINQTGEFMFPLQANSKNCEITVDSDVPTAVALVGAGWDGSYYRRSKPI